MEDVLISTCPECGATYRLKHDMAGKRMRCTDSSCRAVFQVEAPALAEAMVGVPDEPPTLPAEPEAPPAPVFDWRESPPPAADESENLLADERPQQNLVIAQTPTLKVPIAAKTFEEPVKKGSRRLVVLGLLIFVVSSLSWGIVTIVQRFARAEARLAAEADAAVTSREFGKAADRYAILLAEYPRSVRASEYRFLAELSRMQRQAAMQPAETESALTAIAQLIHDHENGPFFKDKRPAVYEAALKTFDQLVAEGKELLAENQSDAANGKEKQARQALMIVERLAPQDSDVASYRRRFDELTSVLKLAKARIAAREEILRLLRLPKPDVETAQELILRAGFANDPVITSEFARSLERIRGLVTHRADRKPAKPKAKISTTGILPGPRSIGSGQRIPVLAHGVLSAVDAANGHTVWADRIGADAIWPPIAAGNRWLVIATEPICLTSRDVNTGDIVWSQPLDSAPISGPVVSGGHVFVALSGAQGTILNFDVNTGELVGTFITGQPLAGGIAAHPNTSRLYVPARGQQIYVLDTAPEDGAPRCAGILTTGHYPGSLRREPTLVPLADGALGLILEVAEGWDDTSLKLFSLSEDRATLADQARILGWTRFAPSYDPEKVAAVGDYGVIGLFGFRQAGATDPPLFNVAAREPAPSPASRTPQRSIVQLMEDNSVLALVGGQLKQWKLVLDRRAGRKLALGWSFPEPLGEPLMPPIVRDGVAYWVTQRRDHAATLITAHRVSNGERVWQSTFGFDPAAPYFSIGSSVVTMDHRGTMTAFRPDDVSTGWSFVGKQLSNPMSGLTAGAKLYVNQNGGFCAVVPQEQRVVLRRIGADLTVDEQRINVSAALAGQPGFTANAAVLPLANGVLVHVAKDQAPVAGPTWRSTGADAATQGSVTHWHDDIFLVTDGDNRLMRLKWAAGTDYDLGTANAIRRTRRLLGSPLILNGDVPRAIIADAGGNLMLIRGDRWEIERTWRLGEGKSMTSPPVLVNGLVLAIADENSIVAIDPRRESPAWQFDIPEASAVGLPIEFAGKIVVADSQGRIWLLDPTTGKPVRAKPFQLAGSSVAVNTPAELSADRLFVPLLDGTGIVLNMAKLSSADSQ